MPNSAEQLTVLVIEDDYLQSQLVRAFIMSAGYTVITAETGAEALALFESEQPDVVLLDYELPDMSGKQIVVKLRERQRAWLPVLFLSAHQEIEVQRDCLLSGGDDYITKPLDFPILEAKIQALSRLALMQRKIREQKQQLEIHIEQEEREAAVAHYLYERLTTPTGKALNECESWILPAQQFSGDIICTNRGANGHIYALLADATGHGLSAAIGLIPVTQVFHSMSGKGHHISSIAREMNRQIRQFTPVYRFVAATLVEVDPFQAQVEIWNGGMPTAYLRSETSRQLRGFRSTHVALGLDNDEQFCGDVEHGQYQPGDQFWFCSDGLPDAENASGERFGQQRLQTMLDPQLNPRCTLSSVQLALKQHLAEAPAQDDVAIAVINLPEPPDADSGNAEMPLAVELAPCEFSVRLDDALIARFDLLPTAVEWLRRIGLPQAKIARLHTVLMELVTNAVDHGILGLDSALKEGPDGFSLYFNERMLRLQQLTSASLQLKIQIRRKQNGYTAWVSVEDSGPGFDFRQLDHIAEVAIERKSGRGIQLLRLHTTSLRYLGTGNQVEAELDL